MDIQEFKLGQRPPHHLRIINNMLVPRPTADLLYSLGSYTCQANGVGYHLLVPPHDDPNPQPWYTVDNNILQAYVQFIGRMQHYCQMVEIPRRYDCVGSPLILTNSDEEAGTNQVRAYINEPQITDELIRFVNEQELFANPPAAYDDCYLIMTERFDLGSVLHDYVASFCIDSMNEWMNGV